MRIIKLAIISAVVLFLVVFGISLLIPSHIRISRAVNITVADKDSLVHQITDMRQWKQWNIWINNPDMANARLTADAISSSFLTVTKRAQVGDTLFTTWQQKKGRLLQSAFTWQGSGNTFVVQWYYDFQLRWYPWEKFSSVVFDKQLGPPMEISLANLKKLLEKNP